MVGETEHAKLSRRAKNGGNCSGAEQETLRGAPTGTRRLRGCIKEAAYSMAWVPWANVKSREQEAEGAEAGLKAERTSARAGPLAHCTLQHLHEWADAAFHSLTTALKDEETKHRPCLWFKVKSCVQFSLWR